jgi:stress-induced morphogen
MCSRSPSLVTQYIEETIEETIKEKNAMKPTQNKLLKRFRQVFPEAMIGVEDESHLHVSRAGAKDGAGPFRVQVIDAQFNELPRIDRHQLLHNARSDWMPSGCMHRISSS